MDDSTIEFKPDQRDQMPPGGRVKVLREVQTEHGWEFVLRVFRATTAGERNASGRTGTEAEHVVTLNYRDHDHWSGGRLGPSQVITMIVEYALTHRREALPPAFDAARVRRWLPGVDRDFHH
jgi:hypothetical protein